MPTGYAKSGLPVATVYSYERWQGYARYLGWSDYKEMLTMLYGEWKTGELADLFGMTSAGMRHRLKMAGVRLRPPGGKNHRKHET